MKSWMLFFVLTVPIVRGELKWEATQVSVDVHPVQVSADAVFRFSNVGEDPVTISEVEITCGCLAPKLDKRTYIPGERGELTVRFDLRNRTGHQRKAVVVKTDGGTETTLYTETDIPKAYDMAPVMMKWATDSRAKTKTARLVNLNALPIRLKSIASSHQDLPAELKVIREGFEYEVVVTRLPTAKNARSVIRIQPDPPPGLTETKTLKLYVHAQ